MSLLPDRLPCRGLQLGGGVFLRNVDLPEGITAHEMRQRLRQAMTDGVSLLGATLPGGSFTARPRYMALGGAADAENGELTLLTGWTAVLSGTLTECSPQALAAVLGPVTSRVQGGCTVVTPLPMADGDGCPSLCWVGGTTGGLAAICLPHALSEGGLTLAFGAEGAAETPFRFRAMSQGEEPPFRLLFAEDEDDRPGVD